MVARAGVCPGTTHFSHATFMPAKSFMSGRKICADKILVLSLPTCLRSLSILASTCSVCPVMSAPVSSGTSPARYTVLPWTTISERRLPTLWRWMLINRCEVWGCGGMRLSDACVDSVGRAGVEAAGLERLHDLLHVIAVARFQDQLELGILRGELREGALVAHLLDVGLVLGDAGGDAGERAGNVADLHQQARQAAG